MIVCAAAVDLSAVPCCCCGLVCHPNEALVWFGLVWFLPYCCTAVLLPLICLPFIELNEILTDRPVGVSCLVVPPDLHAGVLHGSAIGSGQPDRRGGRERLGVGGFLPVHVPLCLAYLGEPLRCH